MQNLLTYFLAKSGCIFAYHIFKILMSHTVSLVLITGPCNISVWLKLMQAKAL